MKKYFFICFLFITAFKSFSFDINYYSDIKFVYNNDISNGMIYFADTSTGDNSSDDNSSDIKSKDNDKKINRIQSPFKNIDWGWFTEKYRAEKIIFSVGIISIVIGFPIFMVGLFEYLFPQADKSIISDNVFIGLMGAGSGVMVVGITLTIVGAVRLNYLKTRDKIEISLSFNL
jgi:hypothetical protein